MKLKRKVKRKFKNISKTKIIVTSIVLLFIVGLVCLYNFVLTPQINLKGKDKVVIDYKGKYSEKGFKASYLGKDVTSDVKVKGKVNSEKLGEYEISYKVGDFPFEKKVVRVVSVKDLEKPVLEVSKGNAYVCPGEKFVPEKVGATDNYDGDLTKKVGKIITKEKVVYHVKDSSGNKSQVSKKIIYKDIEKPVITLEGDPVITIIEGGEFNDPGYKVSDNCDKEIASKVKVDGNVLVDNVGEYEIKYKTTDKYDNTTTVSRKVIVKPKSRNGTIYLTFDDGPNSGTTNVILDILKEEGVKATFFVTNKGPDELIKREFDEGHTVALHTASHDYAIYSSVDTYFNDLYSVQDRVKRITGVESKIIRFPGGSSNTVSRRYCNGIMTTLTSEVQNRGFKYYDWNLSSGDAAGGTPSPSDIYNNVISNLSKERVNMVLMHDIKTYTRDALRDIIRYAKNNGYTFDKITMDTEMITQRVNN